MFGDYHGGLGSVVIFFFRFLFNSLLAAVFIEIWKRIESRKSAEWGQTDFEENEQPRPTFQGVLSRSLITGKQNVDFPFYKRFIRQLLSQTIIIIFVTLKCFEELLIIARYLWLLHV